MGRFGLETRLRSVEEFADVGCFINISEERLKGADKDLGERDGWDAGGSKKETFILHGAHLFSCFCSCGD